MNGDPDMAAPIIDAVPCRVAAVNASGEIAAVNQGWREWTERIATQWTNGGTGRSYRELREAGILPPSGAAEVTNAISAVLNGRERVFSGEYCCTQQGEKAWIGAEVRHLPGTDRAGAVLVVKDITARKKRERELQRQKDKYQLLAENMEDVVFIQDRDLNITYISPSVEETWGYTPGEVKQMDMKDLMPPDSYEKALADFEKLVREAQQNGEVETPSHQYQYYRKDGTLRWGEFKPSFLRDEDGNIVGQVGIVRDITDRKHAEQKLERTNQKLKETLQELRQTQREVIEQERERALTQMARGIAHNFNNALFTVRSMTYLLLNDPDKLQAPDTTRHYLELIEQATDQASKLTTRIRKFYHPGGEEPPALLDLNELVDDAVSMTEPTWRQEARAAGAEVDVVRDPGEVPPVEGRESELHELLTNLLLNAVDAMPDGGTVTVSTRAADSSVMLHVADTGTGMGPETRARCFEPFFTTKGEEGSGLGLSTVRKIVSRHGGTVEVESEEGAGSRFTVTLPAAESRTETPPDEPEPSRPGTLHVLVVEDEPLQRDTVCEYLSQANHTTDAACDGAEGIEAFDPEVHDLVVADHAMPNSSGEEVGRAVKSHNPDVPVVLLTGFGNIMNAPGRSPNHVDLVLSKPITPNELNRAIARAMDLCRG